MCRLHLGLAVHDHLFNLGPRWIIDIGPTEAAAQAGHLVPIAGEPWHKEASNVSGSADHDNAHELSFTRSSQTLLEVGAAVGFLASDVLEVTGGRDRCGASHLRLCLQAMLFGVLVDLALHHMDVAIRRKGVRAAS